MKIRHATVINLWYKFIARLLSGVKMALPILNQILLDEESELTRLGQTAIADTKILAALAAVIATLADHTEKLDTILELLGPVPVPELPTRAASLLSPPVHRKGILKMNYDLPNDWVVGPIARVFQNAEGHQVPAPDNASFSATVDDPTMLNAVDDDGMHFTINALVRRGVVTITHHEANSLVPDYTDVINIVEDFAADVADSNFGDAPHTSQPTPAA